MGKTTKDNSKTTQNTNTSTASTASSTKSKNTKTTKTTKPNTTTLKNKKENIKTRHFYVYYNGEKLSSRLSGKRPKQAAQKAISSIVKLHNDLIGKKIEFYIVETGRKKFKEKKVGGKIKRVPIIKRQFYYTGIRKHIPEDPNDEYYKPKIIKTGKNKGQERKMDLEIVDGKVKAIKINRSEKDIKITNKEGKEIVKHIDGGEVKYSYITEVNADRTKKQVIPPKTTTTKKNSKNSSKKKLISKKDTKKTTTTKKTTSSKKNEKKTNKKTSTKKTK